MNKSVKIRLLLCGGLGNQLFQYAFARALSLRSNASLEIDAASLFELDRRYQRTYQLAEFNLPASVKVLNAKPLASNFRRKLLEIASLGKDHLKGYLIKEKLKDGYYEEYEAWKVKHNVTLLGYWQSMKYFESHEIQIRKELSFINPIHNSLQEIANEMKSSQSVAVHVRREDYANTLDIQYYIKAINTMLETNQNCKFFLFTDSLEWWKNCGINAQYIKVIDNKGLPSIEDFKLMTQCKNFIIANSTFSWWAAWLSSSSSKKVIAPNKKHWTNKSINFPSDWINI